VNAGEELLAANAAYAAAFTGGELGAPPSRRVAIVTCMDARLDPARFLGLEPGDAHVIRNAGGLVTDDVLRSLAISHWELGTQEVFVIAHTECGLLTLDADELRGKIADGGLDAADMDFKQFRDLDESVRESVRRLRQAKLLPASFGARGFVYDVRSGRLREVTT
jgi:carbonic anhydrase